MEKDGCGVGFLISLKNKRTHDILSTAIGALECMEHRGGVGPDSIGDGAGVMTSIPFELFNREPETFAVASLLIPQDELKKSICLKVFEETFWQFGLRVTGYREIPIDVSVLSKHSVEIMPHQLQAFIDRPEHCRTLHSFEKLLYLARQTTRTKGKEQGLSQDFYFNSLSPRTIIYKALCRSQDLKKFFLDLQNENYLTNFALFHRRFSTNTISTWDKVQPFRLIAHNGEINTIEGNRAWAITREKAMGLQKDELITHEGISDSGNLNGIAEALRFRSSIPKIAETMAILMPPSSRESHYYKFWGRGMEPWDGPAMVSFSDGKYIGARLDRNGFRPCRWQRTEDVFYLSSEAGVYNVPNKDILAKGSLSSGGSVTINAFTGAVNFLDPKDFPENASVKFDPQTILLPKMSPPEVGNDLTHIHQLFNVTKEEIDRLIIPMTLESKEPIGSMGDTACLPFLSNEARSFFDFFYQDFAQVTNPPIDYIREKIVTDMRTFLGRKPNIFEPKELIPLKPTIELEGPVISLGQMKYLYSLQDRPSHPDLRAYLLDITFDSSATLEEFQARLDEISEECILAIKKGYSLLILSDRKASAKRLPIPSLLALTYLNLGLNATGRRLRTSIILEVGDARNAHHLAVLLSHGASSVCPYLSLETAITSIDPKLSHLFEEDREKRLMKALHDGILRIMAKRGISVFRSYQGSRLMTPLGLGQDILDTFFKGKKSIMGGLSMDGLLDFIKSQCQKEESLTSHFLFKEHAAGKIGESHTMTSRRSRFIHKMLQLEDMSEAYGQFKEFTKEYDEKPLLIRQLFQFKMAKKALPLSEIPLEEILKSFGSGAMSFGAISAESQRDLILAFREIGGRSNSGEGGENPYYDIDGITSSVKQLASGRFGVTAEYLVTGHEVQIKIAQGAKPGEGGQLMGVKVTEEIAKARFTKPGVDLISPPPQHDIYSIEDLKELIYELKALGPLLKISVKLVSGDNIGAIAVGVAKAGADIIQISGGDGGTGAASLLSMKHAGLPLEIGLLEVHQALVSNEMRSHITLRADGGLTTGRDIIVASMLGADEFDFGKLLLVGEGCIMARICEKNTCPTGIATHNPKFKAYYKGEVSKVVKLLKCLAMDVQEQLSLIGEKSLKDITGKNYLLEQNTAHLDVIKIRQLNLNYFMRHSDSPAKNPLFNSDSDFRLNQEIVKSFKTQSSFNIGNCDRAIPATLSGLYALEESEIKRKIKLSRTLPDKVSLSFKGSAGQGFAVFNVSNVDVRLEGEANDSVAKGMSGGLVVIVPPKDGHKDFQGEVNTIIGNCALYGATGGTLFVHGGAGDRFAVRNSGGRAIVESVGLHACEYMSGGLIWILGDAKDNIGAGMSGGEIYLKKENLPKVNKDYLDQAPIQGEDLETLKAIAQEYLRETNGKGIKELLSGDHIKKVFVKLIPKGK